MTTPPSRPRSARRGRIPVVLYAHPFEVALGVAFVVIGLRTLIEGQTTPAVDALPDLPHLLYRVVSVLGGVGVLVGIALRRHAAGRTVERASLYAVAGAWAAYAVVVIDAHGWRGGFATSALAVLIAAACLLRTLAIRKTERVILAQLRTANRDPEVLRQLVDGRPPLPPQERP